MLAAPALSDRAAGRPGVGLIDVNVNVKEYSLKRIAENQQLRRKECCHLASNYEGCTADCQLV
jgi:hypothetical protein